MTKETKGRMLYNIITKFGFEHPYTAKFCKILNKPNVHDNTIQILYITYINI